jgi:hypothetical protein
VSDSEQKPPNLFGGGKTRLQFLFARANKNCKPERAIAKIYLGFLLLWVAAPMLILTLKRFKKIVVLQ